MLARTLAAGAVTLVATALTAAALAPAAARSPLAGTWTGQMEPTGSGVSRGYTYRLTIAADGRSGSWRSRNCRGTLHYVRKQDGYTLFQERLTGGTPCAGNGRDMVRRRGAGLFVRFRSARGRAYDSEGTLRRAG